MPAGIIRGALTRLGLHGTVTPETNAPQCTLSMVPAEQFTEEGQQVHSKSKSPNRLEEINLRL